MPKQTTNQLIDAISEVIEGFDFSDFGMDEMEQRIREDRVAQEWIQELARQIARAVR